MPVLRIPNTTSKDEFLHVTRARAYASKHTPGGLTQA